MSWKRGVITVRNRLIYIRWIVLNREAILFDGDAFRNRGLMTAFESSHPVLQKSNCQTLKKGKALNPSIWVLVPNKGRGVKYGREFT